MGIYKSHLVSESLQDSLDHVVNVTGDSAHVGDLLLKAEGLVDDDLGGRDLLSLYCDLYFKNERGVSCLFVCFVRNEKNRFNLPVSGNTTSSSDLMTFILAKKFEKK